LRDALGNLGHVLGRNTIKRILKGHGHSPAPERGKRMPWKISPEFNPIEGVWKTTKKRTTHDRFYRTTEERDAALCATFGTFQSQPSLIATHLTRFL
jgi:transposase